MQKLLTLVAIVSFGLFSYQINAQCPAGQVEVEITVITDNWGYETYWQLVPSGNNCNQGTIFAGGNAAQVGCNGAGDQDASVGNGYANNSTNNEGPWCLTEDADFDIISIDDYGDGGAIFEVTINGFQSHTFTATDPSMVFTFTAAEPPAVDAGIDKNTTNDFTVTGQVPVLALVQNYGQNPINSLDLSYSVDGGTPVSATVSGLNISFGETQEITHPNPWLANNPGSYNVQVEVSNVNGGSGDANTSNNSVTKPVKISHGIPNIIDNYLSSQYTFETIADGADQVNTPRDLDFHPDLERNELWVINKGTENSGGSTVTIFDAGTGSQTEEYRQDGNAWHFMSLPTAMAFGDNGDWANAPGVQDANHGGGTFTGPSLWSSDMSIYGIVGNPPTAEFNGSHLDMLHGSPYSMGIAHEKGNVYWIFDSYNEHLVRYDFQEDHGPGQHYHGDALVLRYTDITTQRNGLTIPNHMVIDDNTNWMYIADHRNSQVIRVDVTTGTNNGPMALVNEPLAQHMEMLNATNQVAIGNDITTPTGVEVIDNRLLVSDYNTGDIYVYDISGSTPTQLGIISTGGQGIMGIKVGPNGRIWYVDHDNNEVKKINVDGPLAGIDQIENELRLYPNPVINQLSIDFSEALTGELKLFDMTGKQVHFENVSGSQVTISTEHLDQGMYIAHVESKGQVMTKSFIKQ